MTEIQWWSFYTTEAAHKASYAMNSFFDNESRARAQRDAAYLYEAARKVRDSFVPPSLKER